MEALYSDTQSPSDFKYERGVPLDAAEEETKEKSYESKKPESKSEDSKKTESDEVESMAGSKESGFESMSGTIYDKIGFKEEQLAIGIDPDMVCCVKNIIMSIEYEIHV